MIFLPSEKMNINKFVDAQLPTKAQIFSRTGQRAVSPAGSYSGDEAVCFGLKPTEQAEAFAQTAESFEVPTDE